MNFNIKQYQKEKHKNDKSKNKTEKKTKYNVFLGTLIASWRRSLLFFLFLAYFLSLMFLLLLLLLLLFLLQTKNSVRAIENCLTFTCCCWSVFCLEQSTLWSTWFYILRYIGIYFYINCTKAYRITTNLNFHLCHDQFEQDDAGPTRHFIKVICICIYMLYIYNICFIYVINI